MGTLTMSMHERRRLEVLGRVQAGELTLVEGAKLLKLSYRQLKRSWARFQEQGDAGLVHRLRGRPSNRRSDRELRGAAVELVREKYSDYGATLAAEVLAAEEGLSVPVSTLRRWLKQEGLCPVRRRRGRHRRRRERRAQLGELLQMDGSHHDWFEGRRAWAVLMVLVDDATGRVFARFFENESWRSAAESFLAYTLKYGLPRALYVDRAGIYRAEREATPAELLQGAEPQTQFGRAMEELGVELILARSPQAKGRVERMNGTLQDRLVKALRRAGISDLPSANAFLEETFLPGFNARFMCAASTPGDVHRRRRSREKLMRSLDVREPRVVQKDWTVRWRNGFLQLPSSAAKQVRSGSRVQVSQRLDGSLHVLAGGREVPHAPVRSQPSPTNRRKRRPKGGPTGSSQGRKPGPHHPWRGTQPTAPAPPK